MKPLLSKTIAALGLSIFLMALQPELRATHYMGGEITWECTPQGNFRFTMILYRECYTQNGSNAYTFDQIINMQSNVPGFASIQMNRIVLEDMSPQCSCPGGLNINCSGMPNATANLGAMQRNIYTSDAAYPNGVPLTGVPPATGWFFGYGVCCRNPCHNIPNTSSRSFFLRAFMYPYQSTPVNTCFDNSPRFQEPPSAVACTGYPYTYNHLASDNEMDSLVYEWATPLDGTINSHITTYFPGFSYLSPLPDTTHNPNNVPATLDPNTGEISFTSFTNGAFVIVVKVTSWKNGIKVAEVFREIQVVLTPCQINNPPMVHPIPNLTAVTPDHYHIIATIGDTVSFALWISDNDTCPGTVQPNSVQLKAFGESFGAPINQLPCPYLPCAFLSPSPTDTTPLEMQGDLHTTFTWVVDANHLSYSGGQVTPKTHTFLFLYQDNHCPVPAKGVLKVTVEVTTPFPLSKTEISCLQVMPDGNVILHWEPSPVPVSGFIEYQVMAATDPQGPFTLMGTLPNIQNTAFLYTGSNTMISPAHFYINTHVLANVPFLVPSTQTASTILLTANQHTHTPGLIKLEWNHTHAGKLPQATGMYEIFRDDGSGSWSLILTTSARTFNDNVSSLTSPVRYKVETVTNNSGTGNFLCRSISNIATVIDVNVPEASPPENAPFIFPNPANDHFIISTGYLNGTASLRIITLSGITASEQQIHLTQGGTCSIEIPGLPPGMYLVIITTDNHTYSTKLIIK